MQKIKLDQTETFSILVKAYPSVFTHGKGRALVAVKWDLEGFSAYSLGGDISVMYREDSDLMRALGLLMVELHKGSKGIIKIRQIPPITFRSVMIDVSRNGVIKPEYLKKILVKLSLLGINYVCLYTEDTYEVDGQPLFGYHRGKYLKSELKEVSTFAKKFGITMFPCIQTLGHLAQLLKFPQYAEYKDTEDVLNVKNPKTYKLIEQFIKNASEPYETDIIHIGMDETNGLGRGKTLESGQLFKQKEMYLNHTKKVVGICKKLKLNPMMWGDMILGTSNSAEGMAGQAKMMPKDVEMIYWDYYKDKKIKYEENVKRFRKFGYNPLTAPGVWNWHSFWCKFEIAKNTITPLLEVTKEQGIKRSMVTMWGDDGAECPFDSCWPALALYSEHCYVAKPEEKVMQQLVEVITGDSWEKYLLPVRMTRVSSKTVNGGADMGKSFLYDDPLFGVFAMHPVAAGYKKKLNPLYETIYKEIKKIMPEVNSSNKLLFAFALSMADVLRVKADFRNDLFKAYKAGNKSGLRKALKLIPLLKKRYETLSKAHRAIWLFERKPEGMEVLDMRYGGQLKRLEVTAGVLKDYLSGRISGIAELEEKPQAIFGKFPFNKTPGYRRYVALTIEK